MPHQIFRYPHRVTYAECTVGNHIYYARYLDLLEAARGEFFRSLGIPLLALQTEGTLFPVVEARLRYKAPARYDDVLTIELWLTELSRVKVEFAYRIIGPSGNLLVDGTTVHVATGLDEKPKRMDAELVKKLEAFLVAGCIPALPR